MNPEFRRNLWLELTPRRMTLMVVILALAFFAAALTGQYRPAGLAEFLYYMIVVIWGARNAAISVVGEIRDRTWDSQRLSSLGAGEMMWGKLFGSTIYNWFGGAICLAVLLIYGFANNGLVATILDAIYYVAVGIVAQSASLLASLVAVRRRQSHTRFEIFTYQVAGLIAALGAFYIWEAADPAGSLVPRKLPTDFIPWWGQRLDARVFLLISLAIFTSWTLVGCYRQMRLELKMRNGPWVWASFLIFMGLYVAGFDAWLTQDPKMADWSTVALRLALAATTYATFTYVMVLLEPKDRVLYRWLGTQLRGGRLDRFLGSAQAWMTSYLATVTVSIALIVWIGVSRPDALWAQAFIVSCLGFLTRDAGIFVLFQTFPGRWRGDFGAVIVLFALYALVPAVLDGLGLKAALALFYPQSTEPVWLCAAAAWAQALVVAVIAIGRLALTEKSAVAARA
ncbi:MAG: hypothetical protein HY243_01710 [Proteobacteria bacterium]|nr:hypothetical protein [Pseudomonadota bacterium]